MQWCQIFANFSHCVKAQWSVCEVMGLVTSRVMVACDNDTIDTSGSPPLHPPWSSKSVLYPDLDCYNATFIEIKISSWERELFILILESRCGTLSVLTPFLAKCRASYDIRRNDAVISVLCYFFQIFWLCSSYFKELQFCISSVEWQLCLTSLFGFTKLVQ